MAPSRRTSINVRAEEEIEANGKRKKPSKSFQEPPKKRQRADSFMFESRSDDESNTSAVNGFHRQSSNGRLPGKTNPAKNKSTMNGSAPSRRVVNGNSKTSREFSPSPDLSEISDDIISRAPVTPPKRPIQIQARFSQTPTKSRPSKRNSSIANEIPKAIPRTALNNRLVEVVVAAKEEKQKQKMREPVTPSKSVTVNDTRTKLKKGPTAKELDSIKSQVLGKLCGRIPIPLTGKPVDRAEEILNIMTRAVQGESNSLLLLGGPGSAKSAIITAALNRLKQEYPDPGSFYTIRLDGQIQTDDKIALKEIARQLALEMNVEMEKMSFADTLTTFLYTLSHPSELAETNEGTTSASVIFILDSFDEFLSHPRQALLYNLFDIAQSRKAPIAVICLGRQVNAIDGLEKRVKSRFGGRILQVSRPPDRKEFWNVCESALTVDGGKFGFAKEWNGHIKGLRDESTMKDLCEEIFVQSRDVREFFNRSIPVIASLQHDGVFLPSAESWSSHPLCPPESKIDLIEGLSQLELALLICATRLETFHSLETFNFNMVYEIYSSLVARSKTHLSSVTALGVATVIPGGAVQLWGRDVAARAWERLGEIGLWTYSGRGEGRGRFVRCEVGLVEFAGTCERGKLLNSAMRGWFKEGI